MSGLTAGVESVGKELSNVATKASEELRPVSREIASLGINLDDLYQAVRYLEQRANPILTPVPQSEKDIPPTDGGSDHALTLQRSNQIIQGITNYVHDLASRIEV